MDCPLVFTPLLKTRVWGGETLKSRAPGAPADPVGESWELADHGADVTVVAEGEYSGQSLRQLFAADRRGLCGDAIDPASPGIFPLMLKLIDPQSDLSVQVHPGDAYAGRQKAGELGKTEAWYVLEAAPGGKLYLGLRPGTTRDDFAAALRGGEAAGLLHAVEVSAGDVVHLPAGRIHALGAGVRIAEIQQNSDTTYRVFDWNRVGLDGKPRELHVDHALAVSDFAAGGPDKCAPVAVKQPGCARERYVACDKFSFDKLSRFEGRPVRLDTRGETFHILTVAAGEITVTAGGRSVRRGRWDSALVPAGAGEYSLSPGREAEVLLFHKPKGAR